MCHLGLKLAQRVSRWLNITLTFDIFMVRLCMPGIIKWHQKLFFNVSVGL